MKLEELKKMIKEEFEAFQEAEDTVDVDVDADEAAAEKNPEDTLKGIFDMLKDYFEGGEEMGDEEMPEEAPEDVEEDMMDEEADLEEASSMGFGDSGNKKTSGANVGFTPAKTTRGDGKLHEGSDKSALQERFQKLANIIK